MLSTKYLSPFFRASRSLAYISHDTNTLTLQIGTKNFTFNNLFLRDACQSQESVDISTSQKLFTTAYVAKGVEIDGQPRILDGDAVEVVWKHQDGTRRTSRYSEEFLKRYSDARSRFVGKFFYNDRIYWNKSNVDQDMSLLRVTYLAYLEGKGFEQVVRMLDKYGICFVDEIETPQLEKITNDNVNQWPVAKLAEKFGYIKPTFYGSLFDVKNEKNAKNIANTNVFLPLHMDLCYYESPPGLQLLHFIQNSTIGGENVFSDSFKAAQEIRDEDPAAYEALKKVPITFHYDNNGEYYYYLRPLVVEHDFVKPSATPEIKEINYSPPFQGPMEFGVLAEELPELMEDWKRGMVLFEDKVNGPENQHIAKMPEGSCVIFDNRRVLHSRLEFSDANGGDRWLMGTYVDGDAFRSRVRVMKRES